MYNGKIQNFTDLNAWKEAHKLSLQVYKATRQFPTDERYGLTDQIRRAAVSITSNIAEGFSRQGIKEKLQFYYMSKGSLTEVQSQLLLAKDLEYVDKKMFDEIYLQTQEVSKLITGLTRSLQK